MCLCTDCIHKVRETSPSPLINVENMLLLPCLILYWAATWEFWMLTGSFPKVLCSSEDDNLA